MIKLQSTKGEISISDAVFTNITGNAATNCFGVKGMAFPSMTDGKVFIYYASSDTRMHVATSTVDRLVDYCLNTESDGLTTSETVLRLNRLIDKNLR